MNSDSPKYASLTAGLLARKGEAVPAAAAFTAEAIAQHIPARRLAQEAERVLLDRHSIVDESSDEMSIARQESNDENRGAQVAAEHRDLINQTIDESVKTKKAMPLVEGIRKLLDQTSAGQKSGKPLSLSDTPPEELLSGGKRALDLPDVQSLLSGDTDRREREDSSALSDLNGSEENWFEEIVTRAISEAEGKQSEVSSPESGAGEPSLSASIGPNAAPGQASLASSSFTQDMAEDRTPAEAATSGSPEASAAGCSKKAASARQSIKSGKAPAPGRSAMRLDPRRFVRLSLAAQKLQLTAQEVMIASLDTYLDALDEEVFSDCSCMKKGLI